VAERAGHAMHTALVQKLMRDRSAWELAHGYDAVPMARESESPALRLAPLHA
jgi:UDP-3-O-[3-hydroxymyristoyl] N-acetylglucosamine deacetylase